MKTRQILFIGTLGVAILLTLTLNSCKKVEPIVDVNTNAAQDDANASFAIEDTKLIADAAAKGSLLERPMGSPCGTIRKDSSAAYDTIDIHFPAGCTSPDGRVRQGDIIVYWPKDSGYFDSAVVVTMTWKNYSFTTLSGTMIGVSGIRTLKNTSPDTLGDNSWYSINNITLTYSGGQTVTWNSAWTSTLVGIDTAFYYLVTGAASGISRDGIEFNSTIAHPLYWAAYWLNTSVKIPACSCFQSGNVEYTRSGKPYPMYLNYTSGIGNCSRSALATINTSTYNITLP